MNAIDRVEQIKAYIADQENTIMLLNRNYVEDKAHQSMMYNATKCLDGLKEELAQAIEACKDTPRGRLMDKVMSLEDRIALIQMADRLTNEDKDAIRECEQELAKCNKALEQMTA